MGFMGLFLNSENQRFQHVRVDWESPRAGMIRGATIIVIERNLGKFWEFVDPKITEKSNNNDNYLGRIFTDHTLVHPLNCRVG